ncbi:sensor histidine kinase [Frankia sp. CNm7]|uniref:histidine kinase n=1 Tax=Frankia nepalensis TaxID=1836974 RepID=A0A937UKQ4_9ACTN|nr:histidine kinase [Frankia nepalensis]MBL7497156.1 sensor histidine kinase [Frankia nepalensis]MBL7514001.1 sensor histidine kinase [Frankia nepalensis]MBL7521399.1 sensor histidine kinase [Frankia nepalensis]MBL7627044.1 sensor histidine kinase [Frankia nepalensis]
MANHTTLAAWPDGAAGGRRLRGPFARRPRAADAVLAALVFLVTVFVMDGPGDSLVLRHPADVSVPTLPVLAAASAALCWRRRAPLAVLGVALAAWVLLVAATAESALDGHVGWPTMIALYSLGRHAAAHWWDGVAIAVAIGVVTVACVPASGPWWQTTVLGCVFMTGVWYVGRRLRLRQERAGQLRRERAAEAQRIVAEERTRIARELHDVVAHQVSLMTVQASGARAVAAEDPRAALAAMAAVEEAGRHALQELRHLLGVLRPKAEPDGLRPQPGLADLSQLVAQIRQAGVEVAVTADGLPAEIPARLDLFAYRIVQEALTNVLKHAGPGIHAEVRLRAERRVMVVEVRDGGRGAAAPAGPRVAGHEGPEGHGIVGMRERALLLGGSLDAGPLPGGGFRVVARLPIEGEPPL